MRTCISLLLCLLGFVFGCTPVTSVSPPPGWVHIGAGEFSFYVPPDMKAVPVRGIDSLVGQYKGDSISLSFDYGYYSDPLKDKEHSNFVAHNERIGGKKARVVTYDDHNNGQQFGYVIAVHFPEVNEKDNRLTVYAMCKTTNDRETARTILRTIRFR